MAIVAPRDFLGVVMNDLRKGCDRVGRQRGRVEEHEQRSDLIVCKSARKDCAESFTRVVVGKLHPVYELIDAPIDDRFAGPFFRIGGANPLVHLRKEFLSGVERGVKDLVREVHLFLTLGRAVIVRHSMTE
jgi:hypothetical protein